MKAAKDEGILVLDCTDSRSFIDASFAQKNVNGTQSYKVGTPDKPQETGYSRYLCAPASGRTVAAQYSAGKPQYQYVGVGGTGFAVPYVAGVYALGWQVRPEYTFAQMTDLLFETADKSQSTNFINPQKFIEALQK